MRQSNKLYYCLLFQFIVCVICREQIFGFEKIMGFISGSLLIFSEDHWQKKHTPSNSKSMMAKTTQYRKTELLLQSELPISVIINPTFFTKKSAWSIFRRWISNLNRMFYTSYVYFVSLRSFVQLFLFSFVNYERRKRLHIGPIIQWNCNRTYSLIFRVDTKLYSVRFQVLTAAGMKMIALWDVAPCSLVEVDRCSRGAYCLHHQGDHWWWRQYAS
jgi:hypothetical protein